MQVQTPKHKKSIRLQEIVTIFQCKQCLYMLYPSTGWHSLAQRGVSRASHGVPPFYPSPPCPL